MPNRDLSIVSQVTIAPERDHPTPYGYEVFVNGQRDLKASSGPVFASRDTADQMGRTAAFELRKKMMRPSPGGWT